MNKSIYKSSAQKLNSSKISEGLKSFDKYDSFQTHGDISEAA